MTITSYFFLFWAVVGLIGGIVGCNSAEKTKEENKRLRDALKIEHNRAEYFRKKAEHNAVFDFEKVNGKKEK